MLVCTHTHAYVYVCEGVLSNDHALSRSAPHRSEEAIAAIAPRPGLPAELVTEVDQIRVGLLTLRQNVVLLRDGDDSNAYYPASRSVPSRRSASSLPRVPPPPPHPNHNTRPLHARAAHRPDRDIQLHGVERQLAAGPGGAARRALLSPPGGCADWYALGAHEEGGGVRAAAPGRVACRVRACVAATETHRVPRPVAAARTQTPPPPPPPIHPLRAHTPTPTGLALEGTSAPLAASPHGRDRYAGVRRGPGHDPRLRAPCDGGAGAGGPAYPAHAFRARPRVWRPPGVLLHRGRVTQQP